MAKTALRTRIRNATPGPGAGEPFAPTPAPKPRRRRLDDAAKITWLVDKNPMQQGKKNFERFAKRMGAKTVAEALATGSSIGDLVYDHAHKFIVIEGLPPVPEPASE